MTNTTKKRLAALGMTTILGVGALAGASLAESRLAFPDVQSGAWYYNAVDTVTNDLELMSGYDTGLFGPGDSLTREQFVQILYKMSGVKSEGYGAAGSKFTDVDTTAWYAPALAWAEENNVTSGTSDTTFGTGQAVTREQMAVLMKNYCKQNDLDPVGDSIVESFADADTASSWAKTGVEWSRKAGLFVGDENHNFNPGKDLSRAEAAQVIAKFYSNAHDYEESGTTKATCTEDGRITYTCKICGKTKTEAIAALGHSYDEGKVTKEATCTEKGEKTVTCTVCGDTKAESIAPLGHAWDDGEVTTEASCTKAGEATYTCTRDDCDETKTEAIAALDHSWGKGKITKAATCTTEGVKTYTCVRDNATKTESIPATGHNWGDVTITKAATCTAAGSKVVACTNDGCSETKTETIPALGHDYDDGEVTTAATCTTDGVKTYTCKRDGTTKTESIPALKHEYIVTASKDVTCTEDGYTTYTCANCGDSYTDTVKATGHTPSETYTKLTLLDGSEVPTPDDNTSGKATRLTDAMISAYLESANNNGKYVHEKASDRNCLMNTAAAYVNYYSNCKAYLNHPTLIVGRDENGELYAEDVNGYELFSTLDPDMYTYEDLDSGFKNFYWTCAGYGEVHYKIYKEDSCDIVPVNAKYVNTAANSAFSGFTTLYEKVAEESCKGKHEAGRSGGWSSRSNQRVAIVYVAHHSCVTCGEVTD